MSGALKTRPSVDVESEQTAPPRVLHWLPKTGMLENVVYGVPTKALCGVTFDPGKIMEAGTAQMAGPTVTCRACESTYERLNP